MATLDTKGEEVNYLRGVIETYGIKTAVIDCSLLGEPKCEYDISRQQVLEEINKTEEDIRKATKNQAVEWMKKALCSKLRHLSDQGLIKGVISVGGVQGTVVATYAMQALPVGVPKFMVSTVANGNSTFGPFIGTSDMVMMHSVVDISGLNFLLKKILTMAAGGICGMVKAVSAYNSDRATQIVGITMGGVTTPCVTKIKELLESRGIEVIVFHCNGIGARSMENLVEEGIITAVLDITPHDVTDLLNEGLMPAYTDRYEKIAHKGVPVIFVPGCADIILYNGEHKIPEDKKDRKYVKHNEIHTHVKANYEEMYELGQYVFNRLKQASGKVKIIIPKKGFSQMNYPEGPLYAPEWDQGFIDAVTEQAAAGIGVVLTEDHINDDSFAQTCVREFLEMMEEV